MPDLKVELKRAASFGFRKVVRTEELEKIESDVLVQPKRRPAWTNLPKHIRKCILFVTKLMRASIDVSFIYFKFTCIGVGTGA